MFSAEEVTAVQLRIGGQQTTLLDKLLEAISWSLAEVDSALLLDLAETEAETVALMTREPQPMQGCLSFWPAHIEQAIANGELRKGIAIDRAASSGLRYGDVAGAVSTTDAGAR